LLGETTQFIAEMTNGDTMTNLHRATLENRGILKVSGDDTVTFLQGLVSNDVSNVADNRAVYAALLTPQGKFLYDFFLYGQGGAILMETERDRMTDLTKKLSMYKLRAQVDLEDVSDAWSVIAIWGLEAPAACGLSGDPGTAAAWHGGLAVIDPRLAAAGVRALIPADGNLDLPGDAAQFANYDSHRLMLGLPDGSRDLVLEKAILLESGFDELHGVDWQKGCYMGQELTARTKYRGLVKKRLVPITIDGALPAAGTPVMLNSKKVGEVRSGRDGRALALMRLEYLENADATFTVDGAAVAPTKPDWAEF